jgi:hypothetical protein
VIALRSVATLHLEGISPDAQACENTFERAAGSNRERSRDVAAVERDPHRTRPGSGGQLDADERLAAGDQIGPIRQRGDRDHAASVVDGGGCGKRRDEQRDGCASAIATTDAVRRAVRCRLPTPRAPRLCDGVSLTGWQLIIDSCLAGIGATGRSPRRRERNWRA